MKRKVIKGLKGVRSIEDNVIEAPEGREEHDAFLIALCNRLRETGLTVSRGYCNLGVKELEFFGLKMSKAGIELSNDKVSAFKSETQPAMASELRSFLG